MTSDCLFIGCRQLEVHDLLQRTDRNGSTNVYCNVAVALCSTPELLAAYRESCKQMGVKPLNKLVQQLEVGSTALWCCLSAVVRCITICISLLLLFLAFCWQLGSVIGLWAASCKQPLSLGTMSVAVSLCLLSVHMTDYGYQLSVARADLWLSLLRSEP